MDRYIYLAMTGAQQLLQQQAVAASNLANASTSGYKAETTAFRVAPLVGGAGMPTRAYGVTSTTGADFAAGTVQPTGRALDVAIEGDGFLAVQALDGTEAYTRNGSLAISPDGELRTRGGLAVVGEGGPIVVPPDAAIAIGRDGTVSATSEADGTSTVTVVGRLKLVNPPTSSLARSGDALFRLRGGGAADADPAVVVTAGALESSNVNAVSAMVDMINLARQFDLTMKLLQHADANEQRATQLIGGNAG
ncbi:MAG: flagellar basal-body rod protein FlgF [Burkholderiales bacterium]|nr:flagellar basal-body rod protein FlgF [Burkholderiales bacterium]GIK86625.1 MAG: flagellar basal-body rod protein FlgF [Betaproteobacteria bacterium]